VTFINEVEQRLLVSILDSHALVLLGLFIAFVFVKSLPVHIDFTMARPSIKGVKKKKKKKKKHGLFIAFVFVKSLPVHIDFTMARPSIKGVKKKKKKKQQKPIHLFCFFNCR
jgi:hypothetical protein